MAELQRFISLVIYLSISYFHVNDIYIYVGCLMALFFLDELLTAFWPGRKHSPAAQAARGYARRGRGRLEDRCAEP